jgi:hypothetical protein
MTAAGPVRATRTIPPAPSGRKLRQLLPELWLKLARGVTQRVPEVYEKSVRV